ncbi:hypothetical protein [Pontibacillus sp. HMF3514]|uniref:hypothetical protein n=1 Tax=Pontibacillus sp. HMF3514 TaxID=2692425 RepID=UPI00131FFEAB|nr:hypothetical protein [Pontibacillus sp. HMF3514]QHE51037.1 hypothetical protein GS400_02815 [Pontibacillus sp. HMF3514]
MDMLMYEITDSKLKNIKPLDEELVCEEIEQTFDQYGLTMTHRTTLSTKKGCYHWHFKKGKEKGVLEITYWPKKHQLLLEIHENRRAPWNEKAIESLANDFCKQFGGQVIQK